MGYCLAYIIKSAVCLALLYLPFRLWLLKETFFRINRLGLLGITVLAFLLPILDFSWSTKDAILPEIAIAEFEGKALETAHFSIGWPFVMLSVYILGCTYFLMRKLREWIRLNRFIRQGCLWTSYENGIHIHCHTCPVSPFSWLNYIVISEKDYQENGRIILMHETAHIRCRHSWDMIGLSVIEILQWFNPAVWMLTKDMQDIHEYEADHWVIENGIDARTYQLSIIQKATDICLCAITNSFNRSSLTKRITMMLKKSSHPKACMKYLYVFPLGIMSLVILAHPSISNKLKEISNFQVGQFASLIDMNQEESTYKVPESSMETTLVIVDGEIVSPDIMKSMDPNDIESISVYKDRQLLEQLYGDKEINGAILITTKKSQE